MSKNYQFITHNRNLYVDRVKPFLGRPVIKILSGMRHVGKSCLLRLTDGLLMTWFSPYFIGRSEPGKPDVILDLSLIVILLTK